MTEFWLPLTDYFEGRNTNLIDLILQESEERGLLQSFAGSMILDDLESMKWFYERCSHRNYEIRQQLELEDTFIPQQKLDDYLVEWAFLNNK
jgi:hypothetical protein